MESTQIRLFDSHAHLYDSKFDPDREAILTGLRERNVDYVMVPSEDFETSKKIVDLVSRHPNLFAAIGVHPHSALKFEEGMMEGFAELAGHEKVRAVGEIGLDYHYDFSPRDVQQKVFERFVFWSVEIGKPMILHARKSEADLLSILKKAGSDNFRAVLHCFDSDLSFARDCLNLGMMISFSGLITFGKSQGLLEALKFIPLDRLLIETDSPYLSPVPFRGKRNEPSYVRKVAEKIAEVKNLSLEAVSAATFANAAAFFVCSNI